MAPPSGKRRSEARLYLRNYISKKSAHVISSKVRTMTLRTPQFQPNGVECSKMSATDEPAPASSDPETEMETQARSVTGVGTMVKKLVRLALACEYSRTPIRRGDISAKVLGETGSRQFKMIFEMAQTELRTKFGMQMEELPSREKLTILQRRAVQASQKTPSTSSKTWMVTSTLPSEYRVDRTVLPPTKAPSEKTEATYTALYTFIIAVILLNNGSLPEAKLERYLKRANADQWTPIMSTEKLLQKLTKESYLEKRRDTTAGEEIIEWVVGPRGKTEVGERGVQGIVRAVYGESGEDDDELEEKLRRSLGLQQQQRIVVDGPDDTPQANGTAEHARGTRGRPRRSERQTSDSDEE